MRTNILAIAVLTALGANVSSQTAYSPQDELRQKIQCADVVVHASMTSAPRSVLVDSMGVLFVADFQVEKYIRGGSIAEASVSALFRQSSHDAQLVQNHQYVIFFMEGIAGRRVAPGILGALAIENGQIKIHTSSLTVEELGDKVEATSIETRDEPSCSRLRQW